MRPEDLEKRVQELEAEIVALRERTQRPPIGIRKRASWSIGDMPLYEISLGSDPGRREPRGHARAIIAIGDVASGVLAIGGYARGVIAIGGLATGIVSIGGLSVGLLSALGGLAIGGLALGGTSIGAVAVGGSTVGYYACGGVVTGVHVVSPTERSVEASDLFRRLGMPDVCSPR
jgi:hypothetical protein